jgi:hypothetical protein
MSCSTLNASALQAPKSEIGKGSVSRAAGSSRFGPRTFGCGISKSSTGRAAPSHRYGCVRLGPHKPAESARLKRHERERLARERLAILGRPPHSNESLRPNEQERLRRLAILGRLARWYNTLGPYEQERFRRRARERGRIEIGSMYERGKPGWYEHGERHGPRYYGRH